MHIERTMSCMDRRDFLFECVEISCGLMLLATLGCGVPARPPVLVDVLGFLPEGAADVGRAVRRSKVLSGDNQGERLVFEAGSGAVDAATLRRALSDRIQEDFRAGRTVLVQGWLLAVTEAALCAMVVDEQGDLQPQEHQADRKNGPSVA
jgi:hypothetical protein